MKTLHTILYYLLISILVIHNTYAYSQIPNIDFNYTVSPNMESAEEEPVSMTEGQFNVTEIGSATYNIPIKVPTGLSGMQPNISIIYNSNTGNGMLGCGFSLSCLSTITRGPKTIFHDGKAKNLSYTPYDAFYLNGKRLILKEHTEGSDSAIYCLEDEQYSRIIMHGLNQPSGNEWFSVNLNDGRIYEYGRNGGRQSYLDRNDYNWWKTITWYLTRVEDAMGNFILYEYLKDNFTFYPQYIRYGNNVNNKDNINFVVNFIYEERTNDVMTIMIDGVVGNMRYRLKEINTGIRHYILEYNTTGDMSGSKYSRLIKITELNKDYKPLKPTIFNWNYIPTYHQQTEEVEYYTPTGAYPTDANRYITTCHSGAGKTNIVERYRYESSNGFYNYLIINSPYKKNDGSIEFRKIYYTELPNDNFTGNWIHHVNTPNTLDFDGDGDCEVIIPHRVKSSSSDYVEFKIIADYNIYPGELFNLYGQDYMYNVADLNNDGRSEILVVRKNGSGSDAAAIIGAYKADSTYKINLNLSIGSDIIELHLADMNRDGLDDIITFTSDYSCTYFNNGNWFENSGNIIPISNGESLPDSISKVIPGDFNGDKIVDFFLFSKDNTKIYLADGKGNGKYRFSELLSSDNSGFASLATEYANYHVFDFDGDGKSDLVANKYGVYEKTSTYWFRSNGTTLEFVKKATSQKYDDYLGYLFAVGDFNGDGLNELINKGYDCYNSINASTNADSKWRIYWNRNDNVKSGKIASIADGAGVLTSINYKSLTDKTIYKKSINDVSYPLIDVYLPLAAVSSVTRTGGAIADDTISYQYEGIRLHLQGKGFLGMTVQKQSSKNQNKTFSIYKKDWSYNTFLPDCIEEHTIVGDNESKKESFYFNGISNGVTLYKIDWSRTTDFDNQISTSHYLYDEIDGRLSEEMHVNSDLHTTVNYYSDYVYKGYRYLPTTIEYGKYYEGYDSLFTQTTLTEYDNRGLKTSVIENYGKSLPLTTTYTYDAYGNIKSKAQTGNGVNNSTEYYDYDETNRFVTRKYTTSYPRIKITYTYDDYGNILSETDSTRSTSPQITTYTYDAWGNKTSETSPTGQIKTFTRGWGNSMAQRYYILKQGTAIPWEKTWYDVHGREVLYETIGADDLYLAKAIKYKCDGQKSQINTTTGEITTSQYFDYDSRGRITSDYTNTGKRKSYSYNGNTVTCTIAGKAYSTTYDSWGNVTETSGPDGNMSYLYHSCGKPVSVTSNGTTVSMEYDDCGNQIKLIDPDAGTMTYTYDALGRVTKETDASGNTTTYSYNKFGEISSVKVNNDYQTSYGYSIIGNTTGLLNSVTCNTNRTYKINYTYDAYNRVTKEVHSIPNSGLLNTDITYKYTYNTQGLLETMTYPGNVIVRYTYDNYGYKTSTSVNGQTVWALEATDGFETTINRGQNLTSTERIDMNGNLVYGDIARNGTILHQMAYTYNANNGNMLSRTGMFNSQETFSYDDANRLTGVTGGMTAEYGYASNGNITFKTGIGKYTYDSPKPHAVTGVENTDGLIDRSTLYTSYNSIGKIATIHDTESGYRMVFNYGPDNARCDALLYNALDTFYHITYLPGCDVVSEKDQDGEYTHQWYYYIGDGVVYYRDNYGNSGVYYTFTDNLGSITRLYDDDGDMLYSANYDPWGKQTTSSNGAGMIRGYTGHEHIWPFGLINMNGRLYDPLLGRFLSTDNFVQEPLNAQNFNRYSYCLNNPLKYNDPSGDFFIFSAITAITDVIGNIFKHGINFSQYNWKKTTNAWKIDIGMFKGDLGQIINKWTWNLHNSIIGNTAAHIWNLSGNVDGVTEMDGMLALSGATGKGKAFTIGHYSFGPENYKADWRDHLFVHEYGHYIQSQYLGPLYLNVVGLPSLASTAFVKKLTGIEHGNRWFETWANDLGARYFDKKYGENSYYHRKNNQYFDYYAFKNGIPTDYVNPRTGKINSGKGYSSTSPTFTLWDFAFL